jgi:hypothetical protein
MKAHEIDNWFQFSAISFSRRSRWAISGAFSTKESARVKAFRAAE